MHFHRTRLAGAVMSALASMSAASALAQEQTLAPVVVTASPFESAEDLQVMKPATVLKRDELRNKLGTSLGDTLSHELGVSQSSFGSGASRPVIRGMEGSRVKILQNGMDVADVSSVSNDHAVGTDTATARQIEILRGPTALLYGSGAVGGLVNVINGRIPDSLHPKPTGEAEVRYSTVDHGKAASASADGSSGHIGLHADASWHDTDDYKIPGLATPADPMSSANGRLNNSFTRQHDLGFGTSYIADWGYVGASIGSLNDHYGIPTADRTYIDVNKTRYDIDGLVDKPLSGFESLKFKLGYTDYKHVEKQASGTPNTNFANKTTEARMELAHTPIAGWRGSVGVQTEDGNQAALGSNGTPDLVPITKTTSVAAFALEEKDFGPVRASAGARLESVKRKPDGASGFADRSFSLGSYSIGALWAFTPGYGLGATYSYAERAPSVEELYSRGPHDPTSTFDIGDPTLSKESSHNVELSLQKTEGKVRWKGDVFRNRFSNFIFGRTTAVTVNEAGVPDPAGTITQRFWSQGAATIQGAEGEVSYNLRGEGLSLRGYADTSRGTLDGQGNLPLQPATRFGVDAGYKQGAWRGGIGVLRALSQDRLAVFENTPTPGYTQVDANLSYTQRYGEQRVTWFLLAKNLLNQDIRISTSLLKDVAPQPGRNFIVGVRTNF